MLPPPCLFGTISFVRHLSSPHVLAAIALSAPIPKSQKYKSNSLLKYAFAARISSTNSTQPPEVAQFTFPFSTSQKPSTFPKRNIHKELSSHENSLPLRGKYVGEPADAIDHPVQKNSSNALRLFYSSKRLRVPILGFYESSHQWIRAALHGSSPPKDPHPSAPLQEATSSPEDRPTEGEDLSQKLFARNPLAKSTKSRARPKLTDQQYAQSLILKKSPELPLEPPRAQSINPHQPPQVTPSAAKLPPPGPGPAPSVDGSFANMRPLSLGCIAGEGDQPSGIDSTAYNTWHPSRPARH